MSPEWGCPLFFLEGAGLTKQDGTLERVRAAAERVTADCGFELVDVEIQKAGSGQVIRLFVDKPAGIGLDDLQSVSVEVSAILDAEEPITSAYTLEVSSPGLDRPLKSEADYQRFVGRLAKLSSYDLVDGKRHWTGRIASCEDGIVTLTLEDRKAPAHIPCAKIAHGRLEVEFPGTGTAG